jgi:hypothetical protein
VALNDGDSRSVAALAGAALDEEAAAEVGVEEAAEV